MDLDISKTICISILTDGCHFLSSSNNIINYGKEENNRAHDIIIENSTSITSRNGQNKSEKETRNDKAVREFYSNVFFAKKDYAAVNYMEENYKQHNPNALTGERPSLTHLHISLSKIPSSITQIQRIYTDYDYVIVHSFVPFGEAGNAIVDI